MSVNGIEICQRKRMTCASAVKRSKIHMCCQNTQLRSKSKTIRRSDVATLMNNLQLSFTRGKINFHSIMPILLRTVIDAITFFLRVCFHFFASQPEAMKRQNSFRSPLLIFPFTRISVFLLSSRGEKLKRKLRNRFSSHSGPINVRHK